MVINKRKCQKCGGYGTRYDCCYNCKVYLCYDCYLQHEFKNCKNCGNYLCNYSLNRNKCCICVNS